MSSILTSLDNAILTITFNRPDVYNSFNREMALLCQQALETADTNDEVRCVVLTGAGKAFSAGQDLNEVIAPDGPELQEIVSLHYNPIIQAIREIEKPFVAAVNGVAAGAGANIALACDIVVARESASFIQAFSKIGLIPDSGGTFTLPRLVGLQRATALAMLGDKVSAPEAVSMGMIYKAVADDQFENEIADLSSRLALMPTKGLGLTKRALNASLTNDLTKQLSIEEQLQLAASRTHDYREGVNAFLEKRTPEFRGE
ncbi:MAG: enoyl-CoA hydratase-related protein [Saprospiraceae bacterium]|nr:enoyl-CoA hydratase-related protein [Saprospiraceae bacterium]